MTAKAAIVIGKTCKNITEVEAPGAVVIRGGDTVECRIEGFTPLVNKVE